MEGGEERYRNLCSSETLRSGKKGFFSEFSERVALIAGDRWISKVFARLTNDEDRIRAIFTDPKISTVALETLNRTEPLYRSKDAAASRKIRLEGFVAATAGKRGNALLCFSQAVLRAPLTGFPFLHPREPLAEPRSHSFFPLRSREMRGGRSGIHFVARVARKSGDPYRFGSARPRFR